MRFLKVFVCMLLVVCIVTSCSNSGLSDTDTTGNNDVSINITDVSEVDVDITTEVDNSQSDETTALETEKNTEVIENETTQITTQIEETTSIPDVEVKVEVETTAPVVETEHIEETQTTEVETEEVIEIIEKPEKNKEEEINKPSKDIVTEEIPKPTVEQPAVEQPAVTVSVINAPMWTTVNVRARTEPRDDSPYSKIVYAGDEVYAIELDKETNWCKVTWDNETVYILNKYLQDTKPKVVGAAEVSYPITYSDDTCTIEIYKEWVGESKYAGAWTYIAHLKFTDYSRLGTECANGKYNNGYEKTSSVANRLGAIFCVYGCYSAPYLNYPVMRSGVVWNDKYCTVPGVYSNQTGIFQDPVTAGYNKQLLSELVEDGTVTDTFCFGPYFLINGEITCEYDGSNRAQRTFMGTNGEPGDIWIAVSEGRYVVKVSAGLAYWECANLLKENGCTFGLCLDGGGSSTMVFNGQILNHMQGNAERAVVDFVYFK